MQFLFHTTVKNASDVTTFEYTVYIPGRSSGAVIRGVHVYHPEVLGVLVVVSTFNPRAPGPNFQVVRPPWHPPLAALAHLLRWARSPRGAIPWISLIALTNSTSFGPLPAPHAIPQTSASSPDRRPGTCKRTEHWCFK